jgi:hypothetical protein
VFVVECPAHYLPPLNTRRRSPTCQAEILSDNFRGAGKVPALTRRHTVAAEQANSACTTGWRTKQDDGRSSKLRSALGISAGWGFVLLGMAAFRELGCANVKQKALIPGLLSRHFLLIGFFKYYGFGFCVNHHVSILQFFLL